MNRRLTSVPLALAVVIGVLLSSCASESEPTTRATSTRAPIKAVDQAAGKQDGPVKVSVAGEDGVGVTFRTVTLAPGAKHWQALPLRTAYRGGREGRADPLCDIYPDGVHVYAAGESIIEGAGYQHEGRNEGDDDLVLWVT